MLYLSDGIRIVFLLVNVFIATVILNFLPVELNSSRVFYFVKLKHSLIRHQGSFIISILFYVYGCLACMLSV